MSYLQILVIFVISSLASTSINLFKNFTSCSVAGSVDEGIIIKMLTPSFGSTYKAIVAVYTCNDIGL